MISKDPIKEISEAERLAKGTIESARRSVDKTVVDAQKKGQKDLDNIYHQIIGQQDKIMEAAEQEIKGVVKEERQNLKKEMQKLEVIDSNKINQAAEMVLKKIVG